MTRIIVTRPEPGATRTAKRLQALGFETVRMPLTRIVGLPVEPISQTFDLIVATSAQAFVHLPTAIARSVFATPTLVVGKATLTAARQAEFSAVELGGDDVQGLIGALETKVKPAMRVLYLCGRVRRPELEEFFSAHSVSLAVTEVYDTELVSHSTDKLDEIFSKRTDAFILSSLHSVHALCSLLAPEKYSYLYDNAHFICQSSRIAGRLKSTGARFVIVASSPDEDGLVDVVQSLFSKDGHI